MMPCGRILKEMKKQVVEAELAIISLTKSICSTPHYDSTTKCLYLNQYNYEDAVLLQRSMYKEIFGLPKYRSRKRFPYTYYAEAEQRPHNYTDSNTSIL